MALNTYKAVKTALGEEQETAVIWAFPKTVRLTGNPPSGSFVLRNIGKTGNVEVKHSGRQYPRPQQGCPPPE